MGTLDVLAMAFLNLWRRKLRAFLTVLGMVIGVASIVVMVSLGIGIRQATIDSFAGTGSLTTIKVSRWAYTETGNGYGIAKEKDLTQKTVAAIQKIPGAIAVMPVATANGMYKSGQYVTDAQILGVDPKLADEFGFHLAQGSLPAGKRGNAYEIVLGNWTLGNFYNMNSYRPAIDKDGNPRIKADSRIQLTFDYDNVNNTAATVPDPGAKEQVKPKGAFYQVKVTGIMDDGNNDFSYYSIMEINSLERLIKENKDFIASRGGKYEYIMVKCASIDDVQPVKVAIEDLGYNTYSVQDAVEMAKESTARVQYLLGAIGGVALLVAAIGITNTMMMSIFERTKEIGIIKVLGCRMGNIAGLFLCESAYIGLFGGALGLGISFGISLLLNKILVDAGLKSIIPAYLALGAVGFSIAVALLAGLYPAIRAMKLSPLAAIRNE